MPTKTKALSAKDFREPLLLTMGDMLGYKAGEALAFKDTYAPVFTRMHIDNPDAYGDADNGKPWVERWVQFAFQALCKEQLGARAGRGKWMLTPEGVQASIKLKGDDTVAPEADTEDDVVAADTSVVVAQGVSASVGTNASDADVYARDPYLRGLAVKQTPCIGAYSDQAPTCKDCVLRSACTKVAAAQLSSFAMSLRMADINKIKAGVAKAAKTSREKAAAQAAANPGVSGGMSSPATGGQVVLPDGSVAAPTTPSGSGSTYAWIAKAKINTVNARVKTRCRHCGNFIEQGTPTVWAHMPGAAAGKGSAMFHKGCFKAATGRDAP